jgi:hypothetical protein
MNRQPNLPVGNHDRGADEEAKSYSIPFGYYTTAFWKARRFVFAIVGGLVLLAGLYLFTRQPVYEVNAIIGPSAASSGGGSGGALSTLAATAGLNVGTGNTNLFDKYQHLLQATRLADVLEKRHAVMEHLYASSWDAKTHRWTPPGDPISLVKNLIKDAIGKPWQPPTTQTLAEQLEKMVNLGQAPGGAGGINALRSQLISVTLRYEDREYAIALLNYILQDADALARQDQLETTENRIDYLEGAIKRTSEVSLYNSLTQILLDQERVLMMIKADKYYAFDMVDPPNASIFPAGPGKMRMLMLSVILGLAISAALVFFMVRRRVAEAMETGEDPFARPFPEPVGALVKAIKNVVAHLRGARSSPNERPI